MIKEFATVISWDEISGETAQITSQEFTRSNDQKLVREIRKLNGDKQDENGKWWWSLVGIVHLPKTSLIEWKSGHGHHATTMICWA